MRITQKSACRYFLKGEELVSKLSFSEKNLLSNLLEMSGGYVLNFTNNTFAEFFREHNIDIYSNKYSFNGDSKAKRLRAFWEVESDGVVAEVLSDLIDYWETLNPQPKPNQQELVKESRQIIEKLKASSKKVGSISETTRQNIIDAIRVSKIIWSGNLSEIDFLSRLFKLESMPSYDCRFQNAKDDIWQHRINNPDDWPDDWVFTDSRFDLIHTSDEMFLRFLCEMLHPVVRPDSNEVKYLLEIFNQQLIADGWQITGWTQIDGKPVFTAHRIAKDIPALQNVKLIAKELSAEYMNQQITRMQSSIASDPELAIGTAKELVETVCKTILQEYGEPVPANASLPKLVKQVCKKLRLLPEDIPEKAKGVETVKRLLSNLGTVARGIAELRGLYGSGHGKDARTKGLKSRHAKLAVGSACTLATFLFETYQERNENEQ